MADRWRLKSRMTFRSLNIAAIMLLYCASLSGQTYPFQDTSLPVETRVANLVSLLTLQEKISQLGTDIVTPAPPIPRLGVKAFQYWNEALHQVAIWGWTCGTLFPIPIAMSSTWDSVLLYEVYSAIGDEARARFNPTDTGRAFYSPVVVDLYRDPRWGRANECLGEDAFLASQLAIAIVKGFQGNHPKYLKAIACAKHFAVHTWEAQSFGNPIVDQRSLREYYLLPYRACVMEANVGTVMTAYNQLNNMPCPANTMLLRDILRKEWGFKGYVTSDCGAISGVAANLGISLEQGVGVSLKAGTDICCAQEYWKNLGGAITKNYCAVADVDTSLKRVLRKRFQLGEFDPKSANPYAMIPPTVLNQVKHQNLALTVARKAIVLLKNEGNLLPLDKAAINSVAVIGPTAATCYPGDYAYPNPSFEVNPLKGLQNKLAGKKITSVKGCSIAGPKVQADFDAATTAARNADVAIMFMGVDDHDAWENHDRDSLNLPGVQEDLIQAVYQANPKTIVVLIIATSAAITRTNANIPAILTSFFDGQAQGTAIADVLFGDYNPGGKLTSTWFKSKNDQPPMSDFNIRNNRTYMYFTGTPLYPFGYGLSYTTFQYSNLRISTATIRPNDMVTITVDITNTGTRAGEEIPQMYVHVVNSALKRPIKELKGFTRIAINPGETKTVSFKLPYSQLTYYDSTAKQYKVENKLHDIMVGTSSATTPLKGQITASDIPVPVFSSNPVKNHTGNTFRVTSIANCVIIQVPAGTNGCLRIVNSQGKTVFARNSGRVTSVRLKSEALGKGVFCAVWQSNRQRSAARFLIVQ